MGYNLAIIVKRNMFFSYGIDTDVIHLLVLLEHQYCVHYLNTNFTLCLFELFGHKCCMFICVVYTWKSCTQLLCLGANKITQSTLVCFLSTSMTTFWKIFLEYFWNILEKIFFFFHTIFLWFLFKNWQKNVIFKKLQIQYSN
jgi:hypothetical protein